MTYEQLPVDALQGIVSQVNHIDDMFRLMWALERKFECVGTIITRLDVNDEYGFMWECEGGERRDLSDEDWDKFRGQWFWQKGHSEVMWDGCNEAIRWDLREAGLAPKEAVIE